MPKRFTHNLSTAIALPCAVLVLLLMLTASSALAARGVRPATAHAAQRVGHQSAAARTAGRRHRRHGSAAFPKSRHRSHTPGGKRVSPVAPVSPVQQTPIVLPPVSPGEAVEEAPVEASPVETTPAGESEKAGEEEAREEKAKEEKLKEEQAKEEKAREEKVAEEQKSREKKVEEERAVEEKAREEKAAAEEQKLKEERVAEERAAKERAKEEKAREEKAAEERRLMEEKAREEKAAEEQKLKEEKAAEEKTEEEKAREEKAKEDQKLKEERAREEKLEEEKVREEQKLREEKVREEEKAREEKAREEKLKEEKAREEKAKEEKALQSPSLTDKECWEEPGKAGENTAKIEACGYPGFNNTGVEAGQSLTSEEGTVVFTSTGWENTTTHVKGSGNYEDRKLRGEIKIRANAKPATLKNDEIYTEAKCKREPEHNEPCSISTINFEASGNVGASGFVFSHMRVGGTEIKGENSVQNCINDRYSGTWTGEYVKCIYGGGFVLNGGGELNHVYCPANQEETGAHYECVEDEGGTPAQPLKVYDSTVFNGPTENWGETDAGAELGRRHRGRVQATVRRRSRRMGVRKRSDGRRRLHDLRRRRSVRDRRGHAVCPLHGKDLPQNLSPRTGRRSQTADRYPHPQHRRRSWLVGRLRPVRSLEQRIGARNRQVDRLDGQLLGQQPRNGGQIARASRQ